MYFNICLIEVRDLNSIKPLSLSLSLSLSLYIYMCVCVCARAWACVCAWARMYVWVGLEILTLYHSQPLHPLCDDSNEWRELRKMALETTLYLYIYGDQPIWRPTTPTLKYEKKKKTLRKLCYFVNFSEFWFKHRKSLIRRAPHWYIVFRPGLD